MDTRDQRNTVSWGLLNFAPRLAKVAQGNAKDQDDVYDDDDQRLTSGKLTGIIRDSICGQVQQSLYMQNEEVDAWGQESQEERTCHCCFSAAKIWNW